MEARCTKQDRGLKVSTTFRNIHCVGRWIQHNILKLDHTISYNRPMLQFIHDFMTRQHIICINTTIFHCLITNSTFTRGAKYSHPVLITRLCKNFLPDAVFHSYNGVFVAPERATSAYNSCLHSIWTPSVQPEDAPAESSSEDLLEDADDPAFWQQDPQLIREPSCLPFGEA